MILVNVPFEVEDGDILSYIDFYVGEDEPTDLDSEAEEISIKFIHDYNSNEMLYFNEKKFKETAGFKELKSQIKKYIHLKRYEPDTFERLYEKTNELA